jgi:16S rRNA (cytosine967-C5)-methyltransferase
MKMPRMRHHATPSDARKTALYVLNQVDKNRRTLDDIMEHAVGRPSPFSQRDLSLLYALVYGVLRWRNRLDWIITHCSHLRLNKIDPDVLNTIRLGLFQIVFLDRVPASAAVNTAVELTKSLAGPWVVKYVNAVLRKAVRVHGSIPLPDAGKDRLTALSIEKSFPKWLIKKWTERFGLKEAEQLFDAVNVIPPTIIRCNTLVITRDALLARLANEARKVTPTIFSPDGIRCLDLSVPVFQLASFADGCFQVQDEAAQLISLILSPKPGERILDACAGLGGKTGHMAQMMQNRGQIVATDKSINKLQRLSDEMNRLKVTNVSTEAHDLQTPLDVSRIGQFDRILLDAPCSGLGVLRRNPDTKWSASPNRVQTNQSRQLKFLDTLAQLVKPSGKLLYAVCSMEPEENDHVAKKFLYHNPSFVIVDPRIELPENIRSFYDETGCFRTFPHLHDTDGFYSICFKRVGSP